MFELSQCLGLDLSNSFTRHRKLLADLLQCVVAVDADAKAHSYDALVLVNDRLSCCLDHLVVFGQRRQLSLRHNVDDLVAARLQLANAAPEAPPRCCAGNRA